MNTNMESFSKNLIDFVEKMSEELLATLHKARDDGNICFDGLRCFFLKKETFQAIATDARRNS